jgi:predicted nucleic acid-binding protein
LGVSDFTDFLRRHRRIALDTSAIIYQLEANPKYVALTHTVFLWIEQLNHLAFTSAITMTEVLVPGYRENNREKIDRFFGCLTTYPNLQWVAADLGVADAAAQIRAKFNLRTPDAIQAATALRSGATGFVTNDPAFLRVEGIETAVLDRFL